MIKRLTFTVAKICLGCLFVSTLWLTPITAVFADDIVANTDPDTQEQQDEQTNIQKLVDYLANLGKYFGYDLKTDPTDIVLPSSPFTLINYSNDKSPFLHKIYELWSYYTFFAAVPVNAFDDTLKSFTKDDYAGLNGWANLTFSTYSSSSSSSVSVVEHIDQKKYQNEPVSQSILNILKTPDSTFCNGNSNGACLSQQTILESLLNDITSDGVLPGTDDINAYENSIATLSQLNPNTLIAPLMYSDSSNGGGEDSNKGLPHRNQAQQAADFIRYATGSSWFMSLINRDDYDTLWRAAYSTENGQLKPNTTAEGITAQQSLLQYFGSLRVYAAQNAVVMSNLYSLLSKRLPTQKDSTQPPTSQALSEFQMATWRLNNPLSDNKAQWIDDINGASSATVEKEIAVLLAEINYQLYLTRQQQERILLTDSMILMQGLSQNRPIVPTSDDVKNQ